MKTILYYATAGMLGLFLGLGIMYSIPSWNCANGEVVNSNDECQTIETLATVQHFEGCHTTANDLLTDAINYGLLLEDSYNEGYYFTAFEEGQLASTVDTINQNIVAYNSACVGLDGVEAL